MHMHMHVGVHVCVHACACACTYICVCMCMRGIIAVLFLCEMWFSHSFRISGEFWRVSMGATLSS